MSKRSKLLREENNEAEKNLSKETNDVLTDIVVYIRNGNISDYSQELVRRDITQMLIDGENRGLSAAEIVGEDYKAFCDAVISEMPQLSPIQRVLTGIRDILPAICAGCGIWAVFSVIRQLIKEGDWLHVPLTVSELISGVSIVLLAVLIVVYITKNVFADRPLKLIIAIIAVLCIAAAAYLLIPDSTTAVLMRPHIAAVLIFIASVYIMYKFIDESLD